MLANLFGKNFVRKQYLKNTSSSVMKKFYGCPFPDKNNSINEVELIAIDFETTGLDLKKRSCD